MHTPSLFFSQSLFYTHQPRKRKRLQGVRRDLIRDHNRNVWGFLCVRVCVCANKVNEWQNDKLKDKGSVRRGES